MAAVAYLFPGQGAQDPALGPAVRDSIPDLFDLAAGLIGCDPFPVCGESTRYAQPAIVLSSLALWRDIAPTADAAAFAGHSLGELGALCAAGVLSERDAVELAVLRGELMARSGEERGESTMLAVLKGTPEAAAQLAADFGLFVANDNAPGQVVIAGAVDAVTQARGAARERGLRAIELDVAGAFHTPFMEGAREPFAERLAEIEFGAATVPVICGLTAQPFVNPREELAEAITAPVRWREVMLTLHGMGMEGYVDVGPGTVLEKLVERNLAEVQA
ncbi:unannotated protein [freshwater metagenome]|uniref:[acyl-carrier-protein] S-malonyltransferase n=1 Tax=freshwater metagenome TaxID=449393 RepID=A0A6J7HML8_9ZZZZ|nr:acyltransferase domain-containing protein [Actinomycetota bacterium]